MGVAHAAAAAAVAAAAFGRWLALHWQQLNFAILFFWRQSLNGHFVPVTIIAKPIQKATYCTASSV